MSFPNRHKKEDNVLVFSLGQRVQEEDVNQELRLIRELIESQGLRIDEAIGELRSKKVDYGQRIMGLFARSNDEDAEFSLESVQSGDSLDKDVKMEGDSHSISTLSMQRALNSKKEGGELPDLPVSSPPIECTAASEDSRHFVVSEEELVELGFEWRERIEVFRAKIGQRLEAIDEIITRIEKKEMELDRAINELESLHKG